MLVASALVVTMIVWMNRVARHLKKRDRRSRGSLRAEVHARRRMGRRAFVFMMVVREGAELVLMLRAVELSTEGVQVWIGTAIGIAIAAAVGLFFFQGTLRIPLHRFFSATSVILMVVAFQLALTGVHELSEAMWIPSSKLEMSTIGPIVRNEVFFFVLILGAAALVVLREWFSAKQPVAEEAANPAARRMSEYEFHRQRRWSFAAAILCVGVVVSFAGDYVYGRVAAAPSGARANADRH
jgi:high-affinity iron transporter